VLNLKEAALRISKSWKTHSWQLF